jgi:hypothetical protein
VTQPCTDPHLGLATTRELLLEIAARGRVEDHYGQLGMEMEAGARNLMDSLPGSMLDYSTVKGRE